MSPDVRRQAFDPFFTTRRDLGCTGLGLHIVHNIVTNRLGGRLNLKSDLEAGTTIRLTLPRTAPAGRAGNGAARPDLGDVSLALDTDTSSA